MLLVAFAAILHPRNVVAQTSGQLSTVRGNPHDFDFEFGSWKAHVRIRPPLSHSNTWVSYDGTSVVRKVWRGRANLGELEVANRHSHLEGLTLRLYHPQTRQWYVYFSNSADGELGVPSIGGFSHGRGEFFDRESLHGKPVDVKFVFSDISTRSFKFVQSYSGDNGKTWIVNWDSTFTR